MEIQVRCSVSQCSTKKTLGSQNLTMHLDEAKHNQGHQITSHHELERTKSELSIFSSKLNVAFVLSFAFRQASLSPTAIEE